MSFPRWPTSGNAADGRWASRSPCSADCRFVGIEVTTAAGAGRQPCVLQPTGPHVATYRNVGGVTLRVTLSADACSGLVFHRTASSHWSEQVVAKQRTDMQKAKRMEIQHTVDTSGYPGGRGNIEFGFTVDNPGVRAQPHTVRLDFTV
jgi:hypothetical protein